MSHLKFNVVLTRVTATMFELETPEAILRARLAQRLERGSVTAFGTTLQSIAKDIAQNISTLLNAARASDPEAICLFGVCYARPD